MTYSPNKTFSNMEQKASNNSEHLINSLVDGNDEYNAWSEYQTWSTAQGRTNFSSIAVYLNVPQPYINDYHMNLSRKKELYDFANGTSGLAAVDRFFDLRNFA
jgi:hypothetical protein